MKVNIESQTVLKIAAHNTTSGCPGCAFEAVVLVAPKNIKQLLASHVDFECVGAFTPLDQMPFMILGLTGDIQPAQLFVKFTFELLKKIQFGLAQFYCL